MARPDSCDLDAAVVNALRADAALAAMMPDGVWFDAAAPGLERFVIVDLFDAFDRTTFGGVRAFESPMYAVRAVGLSTTNPDMDGAAQRIDAVLGDVALPVAGYSDVRIFRDDEQPRIRHIDVDDHDATIRFYNRGGHYRIHAALLDAAP